MKLDINYRFHDLWYFGSNDKTACDIRFCTVQDLLKKYSEDEIIKFIEIYGPYNFPATCAFEAYEKWKRKKDRIKKLKSFLKLFTLRS